MIVLASASARRQELLRSAGVDFVIAPADLDESILPSEKPLDYVTRLARDKAAAVRAQYPHATVIGADTSVIVGEEILGKPADADDAARMLTLLSGRWHEVTTGYCVMHRDDVVVAAVTTAVEMVPISAADCAAYVASREWDGKAGGYAIQGLASAFCKQLRGSYSNVVGLPLCEVIATLRTVGALGANWKLFGDRG